MERMLKVYDGEPLGISKIPDARVIERYPAFLLVGASEEAKAAIAHACLIEDITEQYRLDGGGEEIVSASPEEHAAAYTKPEVSALPDGPHHYIVQFIGPIKKAWLAGLTKAGAELIEPQEGFSVVALLSPDAFSSISKLPFIRWLGHLPYNARMSRHVRQQTGREEPLPSDGTPKGCFIDSAYVIQFFRAGQASEAGEAIRKLGFDIIEFPEGAKVMVVRFSRQCGGSAEERLASLSRIHGVRHVAAKPIRRLSSNRAGHVMGTERSLGLPPGLGLSGDGEVIGICDSGLDNGNPKAIHPDFLGRIKILRSYPVAPSYDSYIHNPGHDDGPADLNIGHGTHTAGAILGDGTASADLEATAGRVRGLSFRARLVFQAIEQGLDWKDPKWLSEYGKYVFAGLPVDLRSIFAFAYSKGARIHSNSWGGGDPGAYDSDCQIVDQFIWDKPDFCILFSAGNDGVDADNDGIVDLGSISAPGTAKNVITVGASQNDRPEVTLTYGDNERWKERFKAEPIKSEKVADDASRVAAFSSRGPTADGRIKPDLVAPGTFILSARSRALADDVVNYGLLEGNKLYMYMCGTSMATPLVAGAVGVVREYLRKVVQMKSPSAALLKAALIAGAAPVGPGAVPDNNQGFGRLNLDNVLAPQAPLKAIFVEGRGISTGDLREKIITVRQAGQDLRVVMVYSDYPGPRLVNNLNLVLRDPAGAAHIGNAGAAGSFDATNNIELVIVRQASVGDYRLQIIGSNIPKGPQRYALVIIGAV